MPRKPNVPFAPAKSVVANVVLASLRTDPRFRVCVDQREETKYAANYTALRNGRAVAVEKTLVSDVNILAADDGSFSEFGYAATRDVTNFDRKAANFGMNSNLRLEGLDRFPPIGFRFRTAGEVDKFFEAFTALPRLP